MSFSGQGHSEKKPWQLWRAIALAVITAVTPPPPLNTKQNIIHTYVRYVCSYVARNRFINRAMKNTAYRAAESKCSNPNLHRAPYCRTALDFVFVGSLTFCLTSIHNHHVFFSVMGCNHSRELIKCASTVMLRVFIFN